MRKFVYCTALALVLGGCQQGGAKPLADAGSPATADIAAQSKAHWMADPLGFAQGACGSCHAVEHGALSPNPHAPGFEEIANQPGLTRDTLATFLLDAHNYPEAMDFDLDAELAQALSGYIVTLQQPGYEPPPS